MKLIEGLGEFLHAFEFLNSLGVSIAGMMTLLLVNYPCPPQQRKEFKTFQLSYQNKRCEQDVRKTDQQTDRKMYLSKQKLFRMSTECQKNRRTGRKIYTAPGRQTGRVIERQNDKITV